MNNTTNVNTGGGIGFFGLLQIIFILLKVFNVITWSWWIVLLPTLISVGFIVLGLIFLLIYYIIAARSLTH